MVFFFVVEKKRKGGDYLFQKKIKKKLKKTHKNTHTHIYKPPSNSRMSRLSINLLANYDIYDNQEQLFRGKKKKTKKKCFEYIILIEAPKKGNFQ